MRKVISGIEPALSLIKEFEGLRLKSYQDTGGVWTVGWGHAGHLARAGIEINRAAASMLLEEDALIARQAVLDLITFSLSDEQLSALTSFVFNVGVAAFAKSTLRKKINAGDPAGAADEFLKWTKDNGRELPGLVKRRKAERELFLKGS